jgi:hypothetical protein
LPPALSFPDHLRRIFVVSERNELSVSQVIGPSPLKELDLCDYLWPEPNTRNEDAIDIVTIDGGGTCPPPTEILAGICGGESTMAGEAMAEGIKVIVINLLPFGPNVAGFAASTVSDVDSQIGWINGYLATQLSTVLSPPPPLLDFNTALGNGIGGYNPLYSNVLPAAERIRPLSHSLRCADYVLRELTLASELLAQVERLLPL